MISYKGVHYRVQRHNQQSSPLGSAAEYLGGNHT